MTCKLSGVIYTGKAISLTPQVIGNKWDTYLDLLQAGYSEWYVCVLADPTSNDGCRESGC